MDSAMRTSKAITCCNQVLRAAGAGNKTASLALHHLVVTCVTAETALQYEVLQSQGLDYRLHTV